MTLGRETVRGAMWTIAAGVGSRAIGLVGTLVVARFLDPSEYGEVTVAAVVVMTANQVSSLGLGQFLVAKPDAPRGMAFHATVLHVALGILAAVCVLALAGRLGHSLDADGMVRFMPGLVCSGLIDRVGYVPERLLVRDLRFRSVSLARTAGDLAYSVVCVWLAAAGFGGAAIVLGNLARSVVRTGGFVVAARWRDWLSPCRISLEATRGLLAFGVPMSLGALCAFAARRWDNLLVSRFFGPAVTGMYNLAYNLADVPAIQVGEQIGDVLLPAFARMEGDRRRAALLRSMGLLALVVFPLAVGLGVVAPTLVAAVFDARWKAVGPMLVLLSALSVARPIGWTVESYLQARQMPRLILALEAFKVIALLVLIGTLGRMSPLWTSAAVGVAFVAHALAALWIVDKIDGVRLRSSLGCLVPALAATAPMALVVLIVRHGLASSGLHGLQVPLVRLVIEVATGACVYAAAAWVLAKTESQDLLLRVRDAARSHV